MKTEELIKAGEDCYNLANANDWHLSGESICNVIQLYSDQQNKELREKLISETNRANELRDRLKQEHDDLVNERANGRIEWERLRMEDKDQIQRLTKEVEELKKSVTPDPFLYPINSAKLKELVWKLDREIWAKVEAKEATTSWGREQTSFLISQYFGQSSNELTRLRELLVRSNDLISDYEHRFSEFDPNKRDLLVRDIDNALDHKP